jgi:hypothetical protein
MVCVHAWPYEINEISLTFFVNFVYFVRATQRTHSGGGTWGAILT